MRGCNGAAKELLRIPEFDKLSCTHDTDVIREKWHVTGSFVFGEHLINNFYLTLLFTRNQLIEHFQSV